MVGFFIALLSGALMSVQGVFNTQVTKTTGMWVSNGWVQLSAFAVCLVAWLIAGKDNVMAITKVEPKYMLLGGVIGAGITWTVIKSMEALGPAKAALLIVISQLIIAYVIELLGLFVRFSLLQDGMEVDCAYDGEEALELAKKNEYDLLLLDVMLPKMDGFTVCQQIRDFSDVPIVMLTAKGDDMDKILGLEYGADDYITKPFNILEVKARIKAIMRRTGKREEKQVQENVLVKQDMKIDCESRRVFIEEREINLTAKEFDLLELLAKNPDKVYSREKLLNLVWGYEYPGDARTVDVHITSDPKYVYTKWGVGYYFRG